MNSFTVASLAQALRQKKISAVEIAQQVLLRQKADTTNSVVRIDAQQLLDQAKHADQLGYADNAPWLRGIPIGIKDNIVTTDTETTCASAILQGYKAPYNADVVVRLQASGALMANKLNMDEFAMGGTGEYSHYGAVSNPCNGERIAGGSSSGSAAALKAGIFAATLGSDTGGSVRLPAAYCGVLGLKPTYGLVSRFGLVAFGSSLDQIGPMAHTADDLAALLEAIAGRQKYQDSKIWEQDSTLAAVPQQPYRKNLLENKTKSYRIGVLDWQSLAGGTGLQSDVVTAQENLIKYLQSQGCEIVSVKLPHLQYAIAVYYIIAVCEASTNLSRFDGVRYGRRTPAATLDDHYAKTRAHFGAEVKRRILLGTFALSAGYYDAYYKKACQVRRLIHQDFLSSMQNCDMILTPVSATTAHKKNQVKDPLQAYVNDLFTIPANLTGLPALSVPIGRDTEQMPIGAQLIGRPFEEGTLLAVARSIQQDFYHEPEVSHAL
jgi:aspartyl-tRNA(Asn)/glutamyl-tRNA(Gln) amidotransferase subunit A